MDKTSDGERNDKRGSPTEPVTPISSSAYDPPSKTSTFSNESYGTTSAKPIVEDAKPKSSQSHSNPVKMTQKADLTNLSTKIIFVSEMRPEAKKWGQRKEKIKKGKPEDMKLTKKKLEILDQSSVSELFVQNRTLQEFEKLKYLYREMNCATTENIFRISSEVQELERAMKQCKKGNISKENFSSAHTVAQVIKMWLRTLSFGRSKKFGRSKAVNKCMFSHVENWVISRENFFVYLEETEKKLVLISLLELLQETVSQTVHNLMTAKSMAVLMAPVLFDVEKLHSSPENFASIFEITENLIANFPYFLKDPTQKSKISNFRNRPFGPRVSMLRKAFMQNDNESYK